MRTPFKALCRVTVERDAAAPQAVIVKARGSVVGTLAGAAWRRAHQLLREAKVSIYGWRRIIIEMERE